MRAGYSGLIIGRVVIVPSENVPRIVNTVESKIGHSSPNMLALFLYTIVRIRASRASVDQKPARARCSPDNQALSFEYLLSGGKPVLKRPAVPVTGCLPPDRCEMSFQTVTVPKKVVSPKN